METFINSEYSGVRSLERWGAEAFYYHGVKDYAMTPKRKKGIHTSVENGIPIDIYEDLIPGAPLIVFLNGAASKRAPEIKLPIFSGFGIAPEGNVSRVYISDPVLYRDETLTLGWYGGCSKFNTQALLTLALNSIITLAKPSRVIFVGGSGGGFASLYYSRFIRDSIAVVWNPQTDIMRYVPEWVGAYARAAFDLEDHKQLPSKIETNVARLYGQGYSSHVLYLQNSGDWHIGHHLAPFLSAQGYSLPATFESCSYGDRLYLHAGNWGEGHRPPPQPFLKVLLSKLAEAGESTPGIFRPEMMLSILSAASAASASQ
jgi:hypothetical protein